MNDQTLLFENRFPVTLKHGFAGASLPLLCAAVLISIALGAVALGAESQSAPDPSPSHSGQNPPAADLSAATFASKTSGTDSKPATPAASSLVGRGPGDVEATLGKPVGKLQTAQGALWLYSEWKVQFDSNAHVLKVEKDQPVRLTRLDPRFVAASDAIAKGAAERAAADDLVRSKAAASKAEDIRIVSNGGQEVDLPALLADDKITIVDFFAEWCSPCRRISPQLEKLAKDDPDVVLLKIDIVNWNTPVTRQFGIQSVPNVRVFNRAKAQVGEPTPNVNLVLERVKQAKAS